MLPSKMKGWLARLGDSRNQLVELESDVHRRMFWFGFLFLVVIAPLQFWLAFKYDNHVDMWLGQGLGYTSIIACGTWAYRTKRYTYALRWFHCTTFIATLIPCLAEFDVSSPTFWWLSVIPAVTLLCGLTRIGVGMIVVVVAYAVAAYLMPSRPDAFIDGSLLLHASVTLSTLYISTYMVLAMLWRRRLQLELVTAQAAAMSAATAKARFLASMSHEIRTPLYGVIGAVELLRSGKATGAQRNQLLAMQEQSAKSLLALINDVLDWSKLEAGKVELTREPQDMRSIIFDANELYAVSAFQKGLEITSSCDPDVPQLILGDGMRIRQIVNNLVSNAVKFTRQGSVHVHLALATDELSASAAAKGDATCWLRVDVSDTGIGIPSDRLAALFAPFTQADASVTRKYGGTGLGLSICRELAELMGGRVTVRSSPNNGSTFTLLLPTTFVPTDTHATRGPHRHDVLVACASAGLVRHILSLAYDVGVSPEVVSHLPEDSETRGFKYVLVDAALLTGKPRPKEWVDHLVKQGLKVAVMAPLNTDAVFGTFAEGVLYKPVGKLALATFLSGEANPPGMTSRGRKLDGALHLRVLVCEDNPVNQIIVQQMLEELGAKCVLAANGKEALELLQSEQFSMVLMDVEMPDMDGLEATRLWRREEGGRKTLGRLPIVAMTANTESEHNAAARAAGMDGFLAKPFLLQDLERTLMVHASNEGTLH